ncbi:MAG: hypothetical protein MJE77_03795 [Proteobacteria bacterium]|nr:hypothetical protein [Pseudomonadota bacterium]
MHRFVVVVPNHRQSLAPGQPPQLFTSQHVINYVLEGMRARDADESSPFDTLEDMRRHLARIMTAEIPP